MCDPVPSLDSEIKDMALVEVAPFDRSCSSFAWGK
jgi:hypothetical protein